MYQQHSERLTAVKSKEHFSAVLFEGVRSADPPTISGYSLASAFSTTPEETEQYAEDYILNNG